MNVIFKINNNNNKLILKNLRKNKSVNDFESSKINSNKIDLNNSYFKNECEDNFNNIKKNNNKHRNKNNNNSLVSLFSNEKIKNSYSNSLKDSNQIKSILNTLNATDNKNNLDLKKTHIKSKTIIKVKKGFITLDNIENEINNQNNFLKEYKKINNKKLNSYYFNSIQKFIPINKSSSNLLKKLSINDKQNFNNNNNYFQSNSFLPYQFNNKNNKKIKMINHKENVTKISDSLYFNLKKNAIKNILANRIKDYYKFKKFLGCSSNINMENNKYGSQQKLIFNVNKFSLRKNIINNLIINKNNE